jgi:hypothetical protein
MTVDLRTDPLDTISRTPWRRTVHMHCVIAIGDACKSGDSLFVGCGTASV